MTAAPSEEQDLAMPGRLEPQVGADLARRLSCPSLTLPVLQAVMSTLGESRDVATTLEAIHRETRVLGVSATAVWFVDGDRLRIAAQYGYDMDRFARFAEVPLSAHLPTTDATVSGRPVLCDNVASLIGRYPLLERFRLHTAGLASFPLRTRGETTGAISFHFGQSMVFDEAAVSFLRSLSDAIASLGAPTAAVLADVIPLRMLPTSPDMMNGDHPVVARVDLTDLDPEIGNKHGSRHDAAMSPEGHEAAGSSGIPDLPARLARLERQTASMRQMLMFLGALANERLDEAD